MQVDKRPGFEPYGWRLGSARPPQNHPKYILDVEKWTVRLFKDCWEDGSILRTSGYGAISYSWGAWKDRSRTSASLYSAHEYPQFDIGVDDREGHANVPLRWEFPVVNTIINGKLDLEEEQFNIYDIKKMFESMGKRFVWWDWACIPQKLPKELVGHPIENDVTDEMNKMRAVYPYSTSGSIWAHTVDWTKASPLKTALEICGDHLSTLNWLDRPVALIYKIVDALSDAHMAEEWFRSLWCFQEGVLFTHPDRPQGSIITGALFRDIHGDTLKISTDAMGCGIGHLVLVATRIVQSIISVLQLRVEEPPVRSTGGYHPPEETGYGGRVEYYEPGDPQWWSLKAWCSNPAYEQPARAMVNRLMATGLINMQAQHPLSLLNARLGRYPAPWSSDMDVEVNTIIGALEVDIQKYLDEVKAVVDKSTENIPKEEQKAMKKEIEAAMIPTLREGMLSELFKYYQWRMLLFATPRRIDAMHPVGPNLVGVWSDLVKVPRYRPIVNTPFTALETFFQTELENRYNPPKLRFEGDQVKDETTGRGFVPSDALPKLAYDPKSKLLVLQQFPATNRKMKPGLDLESGDMPYKLFQLSQYAAPLWKKCMFYGQSLTGGSFVPAFQFVSWAEWPIVFGANVVLVPLEYTRIFPSGPLREPVLRLRCVVLSNYGEGNYPQLEDGKLDGLQKAVFVGVADIEGGDQEEHFINLERGNLELANDVIIY